MFTRWRADSEIPLKEIIARVRMLVIDDQDFPYVKLFKRDGYNVEKWKDVGRLVQIEEGDYVFRDVRMNPRRGNQRLVNTLTLVDGEALPRRPELPLHPWSGIPEWQRGVLPPDQEPWDRQKS